MSKLAIEGGTPARSKPLPPNYPGAVVMGQEEVGFASKVIAGQSPFRYYSPDPQRAVEQLEDAMAVMNVPYVLGVAFKASPDSERATGSILQTKTSHL